MKNLADVYLKLGPEHNESAMKCFLQAAELDGDDVVLWNQFGTLSCSMGSLSMARFAFEQGLRVSPTNGEHLICSSILCHPIMQSIFFFLGHLFMVLVFFFFF